MIGPVSGTRWTVLGPGSESLFLLCRCSCGVEKEVNKKNLKSRLTKSCGCLKREIHTTHGKHKTRTYRIWQHIRGRTENPNNPSYERYGGRGIKVCSRWRHSFVNFLADMGECPSNEHSIDRIDNDGHYIPGNCQWATRSVQQRNKRTTKLYTYNGKTQCASDWADEFGLPLEVIRNRLSSGWSIERALNKKIGPPRGNAAPKTRERLIEYEGRTQTAEKWAEEFELRWEVFEGRLHDGWSMDQIRYSRQRKMRSDRKDR